VARAVAADARVVVICAGRDNQFALEDALCAGHLVGEIMDTSEEDPVLNDAARAARILAMNRKPTRRLLAGTWGGRALIEIGLGADLDVCVEVDRHDVVAEMRDGAIVLAGA
jgi:2-phosphosulfolactate phosphatase